MWQVWFEGEILAEFLKFRFAWQFKAGFGRRDCEIRRAISPDVTETVSTDVSAGVTENVT